MSNVWRLKDKYEDPKIFNDFCKYYFNYYIEDQCLVQRNRKNTKGNVLDSELNLGQVFKFIKENNFKIREIVFAYFDSRVLDFTGVDEDLSHTILVISDVEVLINAKFNQIVLSHYEGKKLKNILKSILKEDYTEEILFSHCTIDNDSLNIIKENIIEFYINGCTIYKDKNGEEARIRHILYLHSKMVENCSDSFALVDKINFYCDQIKRLKTIYPFKILEDGFRVNMDNIQESKFI